MLKRDMAGFVYAWRAMRDDAEADDVGARTGLRLGAAGLHVSVCHRALYIITWTSQNNTWRCHICANYLIKFNLSSMSIPSSLYQLEYCFYIFALLSTIFLIPE